MPPRKGCCRAAKAGIFVDQGQLLLMPTKCELRKVASAGNCEGQEGRIGGGTHSDVVEMTAMGSTFRLTATGFRIVGTLESQSFRLGIEESSMTLTSQSSRSYKFVFSFLPPWYLTPALDANGTRCT